MSQPQSALKQDSTPHSQLNSSQQRSQTTDFGVMEEPSPDVDDPLAGMNDKDRFGLKGLLAIMKGPYADQAALVSGMDVTALGFDLNSTE
jgi:CCR4-NOT transcription complex subunit 2